jgi:hypothetical protein
VKTENAKNYDFEMRAIEIQQLIENFNKTQNEAETKFDPNEIGQKTILLQTKMEVTSNFNLLFTLYLFGLKTVHPESKRILKELDNRSKIDQNLPEEFIKPKLFGLFKTDNGKILYEGSTREAHKAL